jgi:hypothetical protein
MPQGAQGGPCLEEWLLLRIHANAALRVIDCIDLSIEEVA